MTVVEKQRVSTNCQVHFDITRAVWLMYLSGEVPLHDKVTPYHRIRESDILLRTK